MNIKCKRRIIFSILLLLIILLIFLMSFLKYINSKQYMLNLLDKGTTKVNYSARYDESTSYIKGNIKKVVYDNGNIMYYDYKKGEILEINVDNKEIIFYSTIEENDGPHASKYKSDFEKEEYTYQGEEEVNGWECHVIDLYTPKEEGETYLLKRLYINKKLGIIERIAYYNVTFSKTILVNETDYNMHTGEVTDEDVAYPDLSQYEGYTVIDNRE